MLLKGTLASSKDLSIDIVSLFFICLFADIFFLLKGTKNVARRTHTRGTRIEVSYDPFTGEDTESPSNQVSHPHRKPCRNIEESKIWFRLKYNKLTNMDLLHTFLCCVC